MTDRELLEAAAKAAGLTWSERIAKEREQIGLIALWITTEGHQHTAWNPLEDDGPALRLAVKLHLYVKHFPFLEDDDDKYPGFLEVCRTDDADPLFVDYLTNESGRLAATRRAIVRAAAEIGRLQ